MPNPRPAVASRLRPAQGDRAAVLLDMATQLGMVPLHAAEIDVPAQRGENQARTAATFAAHLPRKPASRAGGFICRRDRGCRRARASWRGTRAEEPVDRHPTVDAAATFIGQQASTLTLFIGRKAAFTHRRNWQGSWPRARGLVQPRARRFCVSRPPRSRRWPRSRSAR